MSRILGCPTSVYKDVVIAAPQPKSKGLHGGVGRHDASFAGAQEQLERCVRQERRTGNVPKSAGPMNSVRLVQGGDRRFDAFGHSLLEVAPAAVGRNEREPADADDAKQCHEQLEIHRRLSV